LLNTLTLYKPYRKYVNATHTTELSVLVVCTRHFG
jgi:hypothetical protein